MKIACVASVVALVVSVSGLAMAQEKPAMPSMPSNSATKVADQAKQAADQAKQEAEKAAKAAQEAGKGAVQGAVPGAVVGAEQDMMAAWAAANEPGKEHAQLLAEMTGNWTVASKSWMAPNTPAMESTGTAQIVPVMGGRFVQQDFKGSMGGMAFTGMGYTGFNNATKKYESMWMDSVTTGMMLFTGERKADGALEFKGDYVDPMSGQKKAFRSVSRTTSKETMTFEMFDTDSAGKEFLAMQMTYTRAAAAKPGATAVPAGKVVDPATQGK
jgi:hypothetical protein